MNQYVRYNPALSEYNKKNIPRFYSKENSKYKTRSLKYNKVKVKTKYKLPW